MQRLLLLFLPLTILLPAAETPEQAAILFAEALRDDVGREKLEQQCALNPDTGDRKKNTIQLEWRNVTKKMLPQVFEVVDKKIDGDQAAVVLRQYDPEKSSLVHIISLAVVLKEKNWLAAPVLSSFQNSIVSYDPAIIEKRRGLEHWMLSRELEARKEIQGKSRLQLTAQMEKSITAEQLKTIDPSALMGGFLQACRDKNQAAVIARLGGFSSDTAELEAIPRKIQAIFQSDLLQRWPWKLLVDARALVATGDSLDLGVEKSIDLIALHPESLSEEPDYFSFTIVKDAEGISRLQIPDVFYEKKPIEDEDGVILDFDDEDHRLLYRKMREQALGKLAGLDRGTVEPLLARMVESLKNNDFSSFWAAGSVAVSSSAGADLPNMVTLWQGLQGKSGTSLFGQVGQTQKDELALLVLQVYSPRNAELIQLKKLWFKKNKGQWSLLDEDPEEIPEEVTKWYEDHKKVWSRDLSDSLLGDTVRIGGLAVDSAPVDKVRDVFTQWLAAMKEKSLTQALQCCAAFDDQASMMKMLRNLSGELMYGSGVREVLDVTVSGRWTGVCVKHQPDSAKTPVSYPVYIFVHTDKGPRMLAEIELKLGAVPNRSREFLNTIVFKDLAKRLPDAAVAELRSLYDRYGALVSEKNTIKK